MCGKIFAVFAVLMALVVMPSSLVACDDAAMVADVMVAAPVAAPMAVMASPMAVYGSPVMLAHRGGYGSRLQRGVFNGTFLKGVRERIERRRENRSSRAASRGCAAVALPMGVMTASVVATPVMAVAAPVVVQSTMYQMAAPVAVPVRTYQMVAPVGVFSFGVL